MKNCHKGGLGALFVCIVISTSREALSPSSAMTASLTTLSAVDRCLVAAPRNCFERAHQWHNFGDSFDATARNFHGKKVVNAIRLQGDCFDVTVQIFPHQGGKLVKGKTVRFTTTEAWLADWLASAQGAA